MVGAHPHLIIVDGLNVYAVNTGVSVLNQRQQFFLDHGTIKLPLRVNTNNIFIKPTHCALPLRLFGG